MPTPLTDADKVLRNDTGKDIVSALETIADNTSWAGHTAGDLPLGNTTPVGSTAAAIGPLSSLTTTNQDSLVDAVNEVNKVTTGTLSVDSSITLTRHTLVKANNVKVLSAVFQTGATAPASLGTITNGFEPAYNVDFTGVSDNGTPCRFRIQAGSNTVNFAQTVPTTQTIRFSVAYI